MRIDRTGHAYPLHLFVGEAVHWLVSQETVGLTQPFTVYTNTIVRLLLSCTVDLINPGFKVVMLAFQKVRIGVDINMLTMPDNPTVSRTERDTTLQAKVAATNCVPIPEPLGRCDDFLRLRFMVRRKPTNLLKFLPSR